MPLAPLALTRPLIPDPNTSLGQMNETDLRTLMQECYERGNFADAAAAGQCSIARGGDGRYNLACYLALSGQTESAFYFLQEAALLEGVDAQQAQSDPDLKTLRSDPRWPQVFAFLMDMGRYWEAHPVLKTNWVLPQKRTSARPIGVVIGLHGLGGNQDFVTSDYQSVSDQLDMAFLGVNGSVPLGPKAYRWSEDLRRDHEQVSKALDSLSKTTQIDRHNLILFGFSQGAEMAFELAATHPESYRGAICFSPGRLAEAPVNLRAANLARQRYLFTAGDGEHESTLTATREGAAWCRQGGASVRLKIYPKVATHGFPPDFLDSFPSWLQWVKLGKT